jgi:hypothetical protein
MDRERIMQIRNLDPSFKRKLRIAAVAENLPLPQLLERMWESYEREKAEHGRVRTEAELDADRALTELRVATGRAS